MSKFYKPQNTLINYTGDKRLKPYIRKEKNEETLCVYCGEKAETREHLPTKGLFSKIVGLNLMILPACFSCNNAFSEDEKYFICFIDYLKSLIYTDYDIREKTTKLFTKYPYLRENIMKEVEILENKNIKFTFNNEAIESILLKIAKGHLAYEFSEIFTAPPKIFNYSFAFDLSISDLEAFNSPILSDVIPELGSRTLEYLALTSNGRILYPWKTIKEDEYRYLVFVSSEFKGVKFVVNEFLFCKIFWD